MFIDKNSGNQANLVVEGANVEVVVSEDDSNPLAFILPPTDDLLEIATLSSNNFSLKEYSNLHNERNIQAFQTELRKLLRKEAQFQDSPIYYGRLASLAAIRRDFDLEANYLTEANRLSTDSFYAHRRGENLILRGHFNEAKDLFEKLQLRGDYYSSLKLASFELSNRNVHRAIELVDQAINIDPVDYNGRLFQGALRIINGQAQKAVISFKIALEDRPTSSVAYCNLAIAYTLLGQEDKAISALKRSVALNPLNLNAVVMFSDLAFRHGLDCEAIPSLRYFVEFEQKSHAVWSRLARALLEVGAVDESLSALKRQASLGENSEAWNNIGVAYSKKRDNTKSISAFSHAMSLESQKKGKAFFLAARNAAIIIAKERDPKDVLNFIESILHFDEGSLVVSDEDLSDLISTYLHVLTRVNRFDQAISLAENLLKTKNIALPLKIFAATGLLSFYTFRQGYTQRALELADTASQWLNQIDKKHKSLRDRLINNIAFVFADNNLIAKAETHLSLISNLIHLDPYPTSVLGLINFRKGNFERAAKLYENAIHLAADRSDKSRIRQKLYIEMANAFRETEPSRANRYLQKAIDMKGGDKEVSQYVKRLLSQAWGWLPSI